MDIDRSQNRCREGRRTRITVTLDNELVERAHGLT